MASNPKQPADPLMVLTYVSAAFTFACLLGLMWLNWEYGHPFGAMILGLLGGLAFTAVFYYRANEAAVERRNQAVAAEAKARGAESDGALKVRRREGVSPTPSIEREPEPARASAGRYMGADDEYEDDGE